MARITARSFPTPELVKTTNNPAQWDQLDGFAAVNAAAANQALEMLDEELGKATSAEQRVAAFKLVYEHLADWRYRLAAEGQWKRPSSNAETIRTPIGDGSMAYRLTPTVANREPGSPAYRTLTELEQAAERQLGTGDRVQHVVTLADGRTVNGNLLMRAQELPTQAADVLGPSTEQLAASPPVQNPAEIITVTARLADRELLRQAAFEQLAALEGRRAEAGQLDPDDPANKQAFADTAYCLFQGPEFQRGTDATMRVFLAAAHTRVFDAAPVIPHGIDVDAMVNTQGDFRTKMQAQLRTAHPPAQATRVRSAEVRPTDRARQGPTGVER